jgi:hypothetical protein
MRKRIRLNHNIKNLIKQIRDRGTTLCGYIEKFGERQAEMYFTKDRTMLNELLSMRGGHTDV